MEHVSSFFLAVTEEGRGRRTTTSQLFGKLWFFFALTKFIIINMLWAPLSDDVTTEN